VELQENYQAFKARNVEVLAISMDRESDAKQMADLAKAQYPVLPDPTGAIVRRYGVFNLLGDSVAAPATYIVAKSGAVTWDHIPRDIADRPTSVQLLQRPELPK